MSYTIRKTDSSTLVVLSDDTIDNTSSSISLVGRGIPNYGPIIAQDLVQLCENFAYTVPPNAPMDGQLWFDTSDRILCIQYNGIPISDLQPSDIPTNWHPIATRDWTALQVAAKTITLNGDISGSGNSTIATTLNTVNSNIGTFNNVIVNGKGLVTSASNVNYALESDLVTEETVRSNSDASLQAEITTLQTEITSLTAVVQYLETLILPVGSIIIWSGSIVSIPNYWQLCDGTNGTYDMRDRFIVGAGNSYAVGTTGGISSQTTTTASAGLHTHAGTTGAYALTINDIPSHTHSASAAVSDPSHVHNLGGGVMVNPGISASTGFSFPNINIGPGWDVGGTVSNAAYTGIGVVISVGNEGGSASHSHTINADGVHTHTVTAWDNRPPYLALAYIQRIS